VVYHLLNRRVMGLPLFEDEDDYLCFERVLLEAGQRQDAPQLYSFCLMPTHWHLLVRPKRAGNLATWMQWVTVTHTQRWHAHHGTAGSGPVYQGRFRSFPVEADEPFVTVARLIERNPLRAKLVERAQDWRWSSLGITRQTKLTVDERELAGTLSDWPVDAPSQWARRVNAAETAAETEALKLCIARGRPFGKPAWVKRMVKRLGLESTVRPRGRPRKDGGGAS